jgi:hypothetical protein
MHTVLQISRNAPGLFGEPAFAKDPKHQTSKLPADKTGVKQTPKGKLQTPNSARAGVWCLYLRLYVVV